MLLVMKIRFGQGSFVAFDRLIAQRLEYTPDKRSVSSSTLLRPIVYFSQIASTFLKVVFAQNFEKCKKSVKKKINPIWSQQLCWNRGYPKFRVFPLYDVIIGKWKKEVKVPPFGLVFMALKTFCFSFYLSVK